MKLKQKIITTIIKRRIKKKDNRIHKKRVVLSKIVFRFKLDATGTFKSQEYFHFIHNNITYKRAYLPDQYWDGKGLLDFVNKTMQIEVNKFRTSLIHAIFNYIKHELCIISSEILESRHHYNPRKL